MPGGCVNSSTVTGNLQLNLVLLFF
jgi:hypothetical protein